MYIYILVRYEVLLFIAPITNTAFIGQADKTAIQVGEERLKSVWGSHEETRSAILSHLKKFVEEV